MTTETPVVLEALLDNELHEDLVELAWFSIAERGGCGGGGVGVAAFEARLEVTVIRLSVFSTVYDLWGRGEVKTFYVKYQSSRGCEWFVVERAKYFNPNLYVSSFVPAP